MENKTFLKRNVIKLKNKVLMHKIIMHFICSNSVSQRSKGEKNSAILINIRIKM